MNSNDRIYYTYELIYEINLLKIMSMKRPWFYNYVTYHLSKILSFNGLSMTKWHILLIVAYWPLTELDVAAV